MVLISEKPKNLFIGYGEKPRKNEKPNNRTNIVFSKTDWEEPTNRKTYFIMYQQIGFPVCMVFPLGKTENHKTYVPMPQKHALSVLMVFPWGKTEKPRNHMFSAGFHMYENVKTCLSNGEILCDAFFNLGMSRFRTYLDKGLYVL